MYWDQDFTLHGRELVDASGTVLAAFSSHVAAFQALQIARDAAWLPIGGLRYLKLDRLDRDELASMLELHPRGT